MALSSRVKSTEEAKKYGDCYHLKILVPSYALADVMNTMFFSGSNFEMCLRGAKVVISKEVYPNTSDQVCLLTGSLDSILSANYFIMKKMRELSTDSNKDRRRSEQVKIIVPQFSICKIIGLKGKVLSKIEKESGSSIQISEPTSTQKLLERFVILNGDIENNHIAICFIFNIIAKDTYVDFYMNVDYAGEYLRLPKALNVGSPFAETSKLHIGSESNQESSVASPATLNKPSSVPGYLDEVKTANSVKPSIAKVFLSIYDIKCINKIKASVINSAFSKSPVGDTLLCGSEYYNKIKAALIELSFPERDIAEASVALNMLHNQGLLEAYFLVLMDTYFPNSLSENATNEASASEDASAANLSSDFSYLPGLCHLPENVCASNEDMSNLTDSRKARILRQF